MFSWHSLPTFGAMLLFWLLAAYVLTRSPRSPISLTAVGAQVAAAVYLLGYGMAANAPHLEAWLPWTRNLHWGAVLAPMLWYALTVLLLREQPDTAVARYLRLVAYPLGTLLGAATLTLIGAAHLDDLLFAWSQATPRLADPALGPFRLPNGPLFPAFLLFLLASTIGAVANVRMGWRYASDEARRARFAWLMASALLFVASVSWLGITTWLELPLPHWVGHTVLAAAMVVMAWNVAAYSLLVEGQVIRTDFLYFITAIAFTVLLYGGVFVVMGGVYRFELLQAVALILSLAVVSHALVDLGRQTLDRLFFAGEVQRLRSGLAAVSQRAGLDADIDTLVSDARIELAEVSSDHMVRLTEQALRRLNTPSGLAQAELAARIPRLLSAAAQSDGRMDATATPLARAQALRGVLIEGIERLRPADVGGRSESPAALQYSILREEYVDGLLNKTIMLRHAISEGTFHRNRREAIRALAEELARGEALQREKRGAGETET